VGNADQCPKQVEWVEISAYVAVLNRALDQRINRSLNLSARTFIELRGASDVCIQRRSDDLLRRNLIDE